MTATAHDHDQDHDQDQDQGGGAPAPVAVLTRPDAVRRARRLNRLTLGWNVTEGIVAISAGLAAGSVSLVGFGIDSGIEVSASLILFWRLHQERRDGCMSGYDRRATRLIALAFLALVAYVWSQATVDLLTGSRPEASGVGLAMAALSLAVMPVLARAKRALAPALGSQAVAADAAQTNLCAMLSGVLLVGVGANAAFGWWWADPVAALVIGALALSAARRSWRADSLEDTCCG